MKHLGLRARSFLMLQGPHGEFFARLAQALRDAGHPVHRINFNGGDRGDWPLPGAVDYRGLQRNWPLFLDRFVREHAVTDIVLFGDCRPIHAAAHQMGELRDVRVHVFEEGYIRPDFVTLEEGGVNGHSPLPSDPAWYRERARALPPLPVFAEVPADPARRRREAARYTFASWIRTAVFPFHHTHRPAPISLEATSWFFRRYVDAWRSGASDKVWEQIRATAYFALPLQLNSDYQLRIHSPFGEMRAALRYIVENFARSAPPGVNLLIKRHPLDPGIVPWGRVIARLAKAGGVEDRVFYMREGDIDAMVAGARGVVTVNSTVGTLALNHGVPVSVQGGAVYKIAGIVDRQPLESFWHTPTPPDPALYEAFRRVLVEHSLLRGGFHSEEGIAMLVRNALPRLLADSDKLVSLRLPGALERSRRSAR